MSDIPVDNITSIEIPLDANMVPKVQKSKSKEVAIKTNPATMSVDTINNKVAPSPTTNGGAGQGSFSEFMLKTGQKRIALEQGCVHHKNEMFRLQKEVANLQKQFEQHQKDLQKTELEMKNLDEEELLMLQSRTEQLKKANTPTSNETNSLWNFPVSVGVKWP